MIPARLAFATTPLISVVKWLHFQYRLLLKFDLALKRGLQLKSIQKLRSQGGNMEWKKDQATF